MTVARTRNAALTATETRAVVAAIVALGAALRLLITRGLWLDETTSISQAKLSYSQMMSMLSFGDIHPPLFQTVLWAQIRLFGTGEVVVRAPSIVFGTLTVLVLYFAAADIFDKRTGLLAALIGAVMPALVWYSQEARSYSMFMLLALVAMWMQIRIVRKSSTGSWIAFTLSSAAMAWSHYLAIVPLLIQQVAFAVHVFRLPTATRRRFLVVWARSIAGLLLLTIPLTLLLLHQVETQTSAASSSATGTPSTGSRFYAEETTLLATFFGYHSQRIATLLNCLWPLALLVPASVLGRGRSRATALLVALIVVPFLVVCVVKIGGNDVLEVRYFAGAIPAFVLLLSRGCAMLARSARSFAMIGAALVLVLVASLFDQQMGTDNPRVYGYRDALQKVSSEYKPGDLIVFEPDFLEPVIDYYAPNVPAVPVASRGDTAGWQRVTVVDSLDFASGSASAARVNASVDELARQRVLQSDVRKSHIEVRTYAYP